MRRPIVRKWVVVTFDRDGNKLEQYRYFTRTSAFQQFALERGEVRRDFEATGSFDGVFRLQMIWRPTGLVVHEWDKSVID